MTKSVRIAFAALLALALGAGGTVLRAAPPGGGAGLDLAAARARALLDRVSIAALQSGEEEEGRIPTTGPEDAYLFAKTSGGQVVPQWVLNRAAAQSRALAAKTARRAPSVARARWKLEGPSNIGGRIVDLAVDPKKKDTIYIAAASGGIWKSIDGGDTFKPVWKKTKTQAMGALAIASNGTLYAGTGEANPGGGSITYGGTGVYRSTNGGKSWKNVGLKGSSRIGRIAIDPKNPKHVYVAVAGNLFQPGGVRGLYETKNAGKSWKRVLEGDNATTGAIDVAINPKNPKTVFAAMWDHIRYPDRRVYAGLGSGLYRTTDGGKTWELLGGDRGLPAQNPENGRIGVAIAPSNPDHVYTIAGNSSAGSLSAFHVSTDGGDTWTPSPGASQLVDSQYVYQWWFGRIFVDPKDENHLFVAGVSLMESTDGGQSFPIAQSEIHADQHTMQWDPHVKDRVYLGNDGGFYRSDENGAQNTWRHATYEPISQLVSVDVSEQDPTRISGGLQDNGSIRSWGPQGWDGYYGGDGQKNLINPKDKDNVYACYQYGACARSTDGGNTMDEYDMSTVSDRHNYFNPVEFDPSDPSVMYYAGDIVNRSTDGGASWTPISPDLGGGGGGETNPLYANHYGTVSSLAVAKGDPQTILAGTDDARLWITHDTGGTWTRIQNDVLPERWVSRVAFKPTDDAKTAYVTFSGFRQGDPKPYVVRTTDGGEKWTDITGNLPKAPVNDVIIVGRKLFVATDVGVFTSRLKGKRWLKLGRGLPLAPVTDLRYVTANGRIYAATFGRSVWSVKP